MNNHKTTRVQMNMTDTDIKRLNKLKKRTEATSYSEVTKAAYKVYEKIIDLADQGKTVCIKDKKGKIQDIPTDGGDW